MKQELEKDEMMLEKVVFSIWTLPCSSLTESPLQ